jgi:hypothetical protein
MSILFNEYNYFQAYIEAENKRLESDPSQFSAKEIIIRIEYKHCPNLTIIDTPGLILAAPGRKNRVLQVLSYPFSFYSQLTLVHCSLLCSFVSTKTALTAILPQRSNIYKPTSFGNLATCRVRLVLLRPLFMRKFSIRKP